VAENIAYPLRKRGVPRPEREARVAKVAETLQLTPLLPRKPRQLSGGQQQRVALGRALVRDPRVFLLDEPLSNLDAKLRHHMRAELIELHARLGRTFVYVTHDQLEAMTMSDRIAVMQDGVLQQLGTPTEVYNRPANLFVAGFIGSPAMNLPRARVMDGHVVHPAFRLALSGHDTPAIGSEVVVGLRPEDITLGAGPFAARVRLVEPTGHEQIAVLALDGGEALTVRADAELPLRVGETLQWGVRAARLHLFDATSGRRLDAALAS
jgi:multiple sugar transport system ATP-binding protein